MLSCSKFSLHAERRHWRGRVWWGYRWLLRGLCASWYPWPRRCILMHQFDCKYQLSIVLPEWGFDVSFRRSNRALHAVVIMLTLLSNWSTPPWVWHSTTKISCWQTDRDAYLGTMPIGLLRGRQSSSNVRFPGVYECSLDFGLLITLPFWIIFSSSTQDWDCLTTAAWIDLKFCIWYYLLHLGHINFSPPDIIWILPGRLINYC